MLSRAEFLKQVQAKREEVNDNKTLFRRVRYVISPIIEKHKSEIIKVFENCMKEAIVVKAKQDARFDNEIHISVGVRYDTLNDTFPLETVLQTIGVVMVAVLQTQPSFDWRVNIKKIETVVPFNEMPVLDFREDQTIIPVGSIVVYRFIFS